MLEILNKILKKYPPEEAKLIGQAFEFAQNIHNGQKRDSGADYLVHPLKTAELLAEMSLDSETVSAALLHDALEDSPVTAEELEKEFGPNIAFLVQSVTKLHRVSYSGEKEYIENFHKMILATAKDVRVVLIKLADRFNNLETLRDFRGQRDRVARETLDVYAPLASRLGMGEMKSLLEDMAFPYAYPEEYQKLLDLVSNEFEKNKVYVAKIKPAVERKLAENN